MHVYLFILYRMYHIVQNSTSVCFVVSFFSFNFVQSVQHTLRGRRGSVIRYILVTHIDSCLSLYTHSLLLLVALGVYKDVQLATHLYVSRSSRPRDLLELTSPRRSSLLCLPAATHVTQYKHIILQSLPTLRWRTISLFAEMNTIGSSAEQERKNKFAIW